MKFGGIVIIRGACSGMARRVAIDSAKQDAECIILVAPCEPKLEQLASDIAYISPWPLRPPVRLPRLTTRTFSARVGTIWITLPAWTVVSTSGFAVFKRVKA